MPTEPTYLGDLIRSLDLLARDERVAPKDVAAMLGAAPFATRAPVRRPTPSLTAEPNPIIAAPPPAAASIAPVAPAMSGPSPRVNVADAAVDPTALGLVAMVGAAAVVGGLLGWLAWSTTVVIVGAAVAVFVARSAWQWWRRRVAAGPRAVLPSTLEELSPSDSGGATGNTSSLGGPSTEMSTSAANAVSAPGHDDDSESAEEPPWIPLIHPGRSRAILSRAMAAPRSVGLDVDELVRRVARLEAVDPLPQAITMAPAVRATVLVDMSEALGAVRLDIDDLEARLAAVIGPGLDILRFDRDPRRVWESDDPLGFDDPRPLAQRLDRAASAIVVVTDLGLGVSRGGSAGLSATAWHRFDDWLTLICPNRHYFVPYSSERLKHFDDLPIAVWAESLSLRALTPGRP